jgi:hypothetical protein
MARHFAFVASLAVTLLVFTAPALAVSTPQEAYAPPGGAEQTAVQSGGSDGRVRSPNSSPPAAASTTASTSRSAPNGALPFTGLDVAMLVGVGFLLILLGVGMARLTRSVQSDARSR